MSDNPVPLYNNDPKIVQNMQDARRLSNEMFAALEWLARKAYGDGWRNATSQAISAARGK
jgi:hypothetical protein